MRLTFIIVIIILFEFNFYSLTETQGICKNGTTCQHGKFTALKWCCQINETCSKHYQQCEINHNIRNFSFITIIITIFLIAMCLNKYVMICLNCQCEQNENLSNIISQSSYQPVSIIDTNISLNEESPPSYEQVMNNHNQYEIENQR